MNKRFIICCMALCCATIVSAQLSGTKWKGLPHIPDPYEAILDFKKDTVLLIVKETMVVETMSYSLKGDTLTFTKISGQSPCESNSVGLFRIVWDADKVSLTSLKDECEERAVAFVASPWVKQKE